MEGPGYDRDDSRGCHHQNFVAMELVDANIQNLTSLWKLGGKRAGNLQEYDKYTVSRVLDSEWPNRLWFKEKPDEESFKKVIGSHDLNEITIPVWPDTPSLEALLIENGFQLKNELKGMSVLLQDFNQESDHLEAFEVRDRKTAVKWSQLFYGAFGYRIDPRTVELTMDSINYFIASNKGEPVGTAVLYRDSLHIMGIHSMGIIPDQRRKGYAAKLLHQVLCLAQKEGATYGVLQASEMGKGLYEKTGFKEDFVLRNFVKQIK